MKMKEVIGWGGICLILAAYALVTLGGISASNPLYGLLNILGAGELIVSSYAKRDFQPVVLNAVWLIVAVIGILTVI